MRVKAFSEGLETYQVWVWSDHKSIVLSPAEAASVAQQLIEELERVGYCPYTEAMEEMA
jgi:hypothetical protein